MPSRVTTVMLSCHQRHAARAQTIPQLAELGLHPIVFLDDCIPDPENGNKVIGRKALEAAAHFEKPVLVLEDDIDLAPDFMSGLELALTRPDRVTYLYLNETEERMRTIYGSELAERVTAGEPTPLRLVEAQTEVGLFGTQAVVIPPSWIPQVVETTRVVRKAFDAAVQRAIRTARPPACVVVPNVVQHRHDRTGREDDESVKLSVSFDCPRGDRS